MCIKTVTPLTLFLPCRPQQNQSLALPPAGPELTAVRYMCLATQVDSQSQQLQELWTWSSLQRLLQHQSLPAPWF